MATPGLKYRRVLLKIGGESLAGDRVFGIAPLAVQALAARIVEALELGVELAVVVGGGNFWRGGEHKNINRATADYIGMLGTVMNALALQEAIERLDVPTRVQTAIEMREVAEPYIRRKAVAHLEAGRLVIFAAGSGNPYFTTDTAASLRAMEIDAEILIKATKVDAVYDKDPKQNSDARRFKQLSYIDALNMRIGVMDSTAIAMCMDNNLPISVVNVWTEDALVKVVKGEPVGTVFSG